MITNITVSNLLSREGIFYITLPYEYGFWRNMVLVVRGVGFEVKMPIKENLRWLYKDA